MCIRRRRSPRQCTSGSSAGRSRHGPFVPQAVIAGTVVSMLVASLLVISLLNRPYGTETGGLRPTDMVRAPPC